MKPEIQKLWRATALNTLIATLLFGALLGALYLVELFVPAMAGKLLQWSDAAFCVGIPASVIGVGYILSIKNPANFTGFYIGIVMSALLGVQFYLIGQYDLTVLYFAVFIPFQIMSIRSWTKSSGSSDEPFSPKFLETKPMIVCLLLFIVITMADYFFATFVMQKDVVEHNVWANIMSGVMIASSIFANYLLIGKKNDSWIYWVVYSVAGIVFNTIILNVFSIVLFCFFLIINGSAGIAWIKGTNKENYGWLKK